VKGSMADITVKARAPRPRHHRPEPGMARKSRARMDALPLEPPRGR
jgi:hypothetical protein